MTRALRRSDAEALLGLLTRAQAVDHGAENHELADVEHELADPGLDLALDTVAVFDGALVGYAQLHVRDTDLTVEGTVDPAARRRGHGIDLIAWARRRGADRGAVTLSVTADDAVTGAGRLCRHAGLAPVRRWYAMARDLGPAPDPTPVSAGGPGAGLVTAPVTRADSEALRLLHGVAFAGHFGSEPPGPDRWDQWYLGSPNWSEDSSVVVRSVDAGDPGGGDDPGGGAVVGYALGYEWPADTVASGVREALLGQLGVDPAYRRRGLGSLLLATFVARSAEAGYGRVALVVDTENTSGALAMYEAAGFTVTRTSTTYRGPVGPVG